MYLLITHQQLVLPQYAAATLGAVLLISIVDKHDMVACAQVHYPGCIWMHAMFTILVKDVVPAHMLNEHHWQHHTVQSTAISQTVNEYPSSPTSIKHETQTWCTQHNATASACYVNVDVACTYHHMLPHCQLLNRYTLLV